MNLRNDDDQYTESDLEKNLRKLQERVQSIDKAYNPDHLNLHFYIPDRTDPELFDDLYTVGVEAWDIIKNNQSRNTSYWFYDFFLLISSASVKILNDKSQNDYPKDEIEKLALLLVEISQMTTQKRFEGDIWKRHYEALATLLQAFNNYSDLGKILKSRAKEMNNQDVVVFVKETTNIVKRMENKSYSS